ncbi:hypothetical protein llap_6772 [Limosa lapponica baueri]|uniref:Rna-directed dna polymerase from mobile element jockey-like n=1 Tax=Limosa lapponica baueri TaxID=1758121 RepID=A0A2I0UA49_LIMLA|nr:hypothetical protein llap_6772 [Limosa lapponica baueri]
MSSRERHVDRLEEWAHVNLMKFNKAKCKVLHLGQGNPWYQYRLWGERIEQDLGILVDKILDMIWQHVLTAQESDCVVGSTRRSVVSSSREVILSLYSTLMIPDLEYCVQLWGPQHKKDMDLLERVQRRATKTIRGLEQLSL